MNNIIIIVGIILLIVAGIFAGQNAGIFNVADTVNTITDTTNNVLPGNSVLNLSNQGLTKIPSYVFSQTNLEELNVSHNQLTGAIQAEVRHLGSLRVLDASYNNMTGVPAEVGQLQNLQILDLSYNQLTGLPNELGKLKNLKTLDLRGNEYSKQDLDYIRGKLSSTVNSIVD